ncbi:hypothetical protein AU476_15110 [Cupriavidus sp. UYMSc13B]|nr:hypothetical protein AU476_15110 [Cupriavidus sp. UYMSc13B]
MQAQVGDTVIAVEVGIGRSQRAVVADQRCGAHQQHQEDEDRESSAKLGAQAKTVDPCSQFAALRRAMIQSR